MKINILIPLPPELQNIMKELNDIYKKNNFYAFDAIREFEKKHADDLRNDRYRDMIQHLIDNGYIESWDNLKPTEFGFSSAWYRKRYLFYQFAIPVGVAVVVSIITTVITLWIKNSLWQLLCQHI